jgi:hypothetical protein
MVGVREIASVSRASTVWYAWVTLRVGVVVARAGKLQPARLNALIPKTNRKIFLISRERFMGREVLGALNAAQAGLLCLQFIVCLRNDGFQAPG